MRDTAKGIGANTSSNSRGMSKLNEIKALGSYRRRRLAHQVLILSYVPRIEAQLLSYQMN